MDGWMNGWMNGWMIRMTPYPEASGVEWNDRIMASKITIKRRNEIKEALFDIILNEGIKMLSTKNLSKRAHISEGTLYRHFSSKNAIYFSIVQDVESELLGQLQQIALSKLPPQKRLKSYICHHYQYLVSHRGGTILLFSLASYKNNQELLKILSQLFNLQKMYFCKIITDGIVSGIWNSSITPENLAEFYMGMPSSLNIELNLKKQLVSGNQLCKLVYLMILKVLRK